MKNEKVFIGLFIFFLLLIQVSLRGIFSFFHFEVFIIFVVILLAGLAYVWVKGDLDWDKPRPYIPTLKDLVISKKD